MSKKEKFFHGPDYSEGPWGCKTAHCCILCKTKNNKLSRTKHWSKNLCRSCYRRLNIKHRLYNDSYNKQGEKQTHTSVKKSYKTLDNTSKIKFGRRDLETLLDRYDWKCSYCRVELQGYNHKLSNAFQLEYLVEEDAIEITLLPICRSCNCSKKNIIDTNKLRLWCLSKNISYPIHIITVEDYLNS